MLQHFSAAALDSRRAFGDAPDHPSDLTLPPFDAACAPAAAQRL